LGSILDDVLPQTIVMSLYSQFTPNSWPLLFQFNLRCRIVYQHLIVSRCVSTTTQQKRQEPGKASVSEPKESGENENYTPKALARPLGLPQPPKPGENDGIDHRSWMQRRDDFVNYDKHLVRREEL
jgi:ATP10 protein